MTSFEEDLLDEIVAVARGVSGPVLDPFCDALEGSEPDAGKEAGVRAVRNVAQPAARDILTALIRTWQQKAPHVRPGALAWALRAASAADQRRRQWQSVELVWTGPVSVAASLRRTEQVLLELIDGADQSLVIVTFAAYKIPEVTTALLRAAERGVAVTVIVESPEASRGKIAHDTVSALGAVLAQKARIYIWPPEQRPCDAAGRRGSLHVKCAVADEASILISSANLTGFALTLNMELGVLIQGGDIPTRVADHLTQLIRMGVLVPAGTA